MPAYVLIDADGGNKLSEAACEPPRQPPIPNLPPPERPCAWGLVTSVRGSNGSVWAKWVSSDEFAGHLRNILGRPVVNQTRIAARFDARLEFAPQGTMVETSPLSGSLAAPTAPLIFTAIEEQLGLRLVPSTAPTDVFIIEHVERPSGN